MPDLRKTVQTTLGETSRSSTSSGAVECNRVFVAEDKTLGPTNPIGVTPELEDQAAISPEGKFEQIALEESLTK